MTCSSGTKRVRPGSATKRGSSGGTFTRANRCSPRRRMAHRDGEVQREVGDVREGVRGVDGEGGEHREDARFELAGELGAVSSSPSSSQSANSTPASWSAGRDLLREHVPPGGRRAPRRGRGSRGAVRPGRGRPGALLRTPAASCSCRPETRTWKNSSRLELKIARNFARSSSGSDGVLGEREHASVEVEPGQLAVEVARVLDEREIRRLPGAPWADGNGRSAPRPAAATEPGGWERFRDRERRAGRCTPTGGEFRFGAKPTYRGRLSRGWPARERRMAVM